MALSATRRFIGEEYEPPAGWRRTGEYRLPRLYEPRLQPDGRVGFDVGWFPQVEEGRRFILEREVAA